MPCGGPRGVREDTGGAGGRRRCSGRPWRGRRTGDNADANVEDVVDVVDCGGHPKDRVTDEEGVGGFNDLSSERGSARFSPRKFGEGGSGEFLVADAHDGLGGVRYEEGDGVGGFKGFWGGRHLQDRWALEGDGGGMGSRRMERVKVSCRAGRRLSEDGRRVN